MQDKVVVVTGASSGIGAALAQVLSARGASVVLVARRQDALAAVAAKCGMKAHVIVGDMTRREEVRRVVAESLAQFGRIDAWVNNVGQGITRSPSQLTDEDIDQMMQVNVKSALYGMQEVLPHFKAQGKGQVVNISSLAGPSPLCTLPRGLHRCQAFPQCIDRQFPR